MIDYAEISAEISRLEQSNTTYSNCEKLAVLYAVANGRKQDSYEGKYSYAEAKTPVESEFRRILKAVPQEKLLDVLEEHFEAVKVLYPKEYDYVLKQLSYNL